MRNVILNNPRGRFIITIILNVIDRKTRKTRKKFSDKFNPFEIAGADITFKREFFKGKYNYKLVDPKEIKWYLNFLHEQEIIFPAGYYARGTLMLLDDFDYRAWGVTTPIFVNPEAVSNALRYLKNKDKDYILKSKRISLNLFTGKLNIKYKKGGEWNPTIHTSNINYKLLKIILSRKSKSIAIGEINKIGGKTEAKQKIKRLRVLLGIIKSLQNDEENVMEEDWGISIKFKKGKYCLIEE